MVSGTSIGIQVLGVIVNIHIIIFTAWLWNVLKGPRWSIELGFPLLQVFLDVSNYFLSELRYYDLVVRIPNFVSFPVRTKAHDRSMTNLL